MLEQNMFYIFLFLISCTSPEIRYSFDADIYDTDIDNINDTDVNDAEQEEQDEVVSDSDNITHPDTDIPQLEILDFYTSQSTITEDQGITVFLELNQEDANPILIVGSRRISLLGGPIYQTVLDWNLVSDLWETFRIRALVEDLQSTEIEITLSCGEDTYCNGNCVDINSDSLHCGSCNRRCGLEDELGSCSNGFCTGWFGCFEGTPNVTSCNSLCLENGALCTNECTFQGTYVSRLRSFSCDNTTPIQDFSSCQHIVETPGVYCCCREYPEL